MMTITDNGMITGTLTPSSFLLPDTARTSSSIMQPLEARGTTEQADGHYLITKHNLRPLRTCAVIGTYSFKAVLV